ncbi:MAG: redoxin domain-containing protein [Candidatus Eremiobacteraeota bacterium]|nr:redoxin domain-containing protein [Candidatus Eremiobacteraeota bacterium]
MNRRSFALACALIFACGGAAPSSGGLGPLLGTGSWLNGRPDVRGKVVVVDVFTVDCINCQNVVPTLRRLYADERSKGLAIVGIHAPETPAERDRSYVTESLARQGIVWPVAIDNNFNLWNAYGVGAWPTQLFFDRRGRLRQTVVGDSQDAVVSAIVSMLLAEK